MALAHAPLQRVLDAALFEPGEWQPDEPKALPALIPAPNRAHLHTPCGLLLHELSHSPDVPLASVVAIVQNALELDSGRFVRSGASLAVLYAVRLAARVAEYAPTRSPAAAGVRGAAAPARGGPSSRRRRGAARHVGGGRSPFCTRGTRGCGAPAATPTPPPSRSTSPSPPARSPTAPALADAADGVRPPVGSRLRQCPPRLRRRARGGALGAAAAKDAARGRSGGGGGGRRPRLRRVRRLRALDRAVAADAAMALCTRSSAAN